ncbi:MAG: hypothetical protein LBS19_00130 [Clostridiales bacterium]|nr:hypothetical protein [Clostridiales bacterium]
MSVNPALQASYKEMRGDLGCIIDPDKLTAENNGDATAAGKLAVNKIWDAVSSGVSFSQ